MKKKTVLSSSMKNGPSKQKTSQEKNLTNEKNCGRHLAISETKYFVKLEMTELTWAERLKKGKLAGIKEPWLSIIICF